MKSLMLKSVIIILVVLVTFLYGKSWRDGYQLAASNLLILKKMPQFSIKKLYDDGVFNSNSISSKGKIFVHFWATWCAPCEGEIPKILKFASGNFNDLFIMVAVNDNAKKVKKFLKKFGDVNAKNIIWGMDNIGISNSKFGTLKVPETYIFNSNGDSLQKLVGAKEWK